MSLVSQPALRQAQARTTYVLLLSFNIYFSDFYRTGLREICRICRTLAVDERSGVIFLIPQGTLPWQPTLWAKSTSNPHLVVRITFARAAPPAYDKKGQLLCTAQTNKLPDSMDAGEPIK